jgi:anti-sigma factor RsiW
MIDEQLEFQIAQYADGTLPESERALVELRLLSNAEARELLEEYRALDASLKSSMPLPAVNWDRLADHLSEAVAAEQDETRAATVFGRIGFFGRLAIAACVVLAVGGGVLWTVMKSGGNTPVATTTTPAPQPNPTIITPTVAPPTAVVVVRGPAPEASTAAPVVVVSVGPSSQVTPNWRAAEGVVTGPSRTIWIASTYDGAQDTQRLPY